MGVSLEGNGGLRKAIQGFTRDAKEHGIDPEARHRQWNEHASEYIADIPAFIESITGNRT